MGTVHVDELSDLYDALNRIVFRDRGADDYADLIVWRHDTSDPILDVDNADGYHAVFGGGVLDVKDALVTVGTALTASGNVTLGDNASDALVVNAAATFQASAVFNGNTTIGNADTDTHIGIGLFRWHNAADTLTALFVDTTAPRVLVGSGTVLSGAADDRLSVIGGAVHIATSTAASPGVAQGWRFGAAGETYSLLVTAATDPELVFKDSGGTETVRISDSSDVRQLTVTGDVEATGSLVGNFLEINAGGDLDGQVVVPTIDPPTAGRQLTSDGLCKGYAYVTYSGGNPTLVASYNVDTITDDGVGVITIVWDRNMSFANYCAVATAGSAFGARIATLNAQVAGSSQFTIRDAADTLTDPESLAVAIFGLLS